ncbi:Kelch domain-containing protein 10 [Thelohanellus kitauei]|uniref:Kelch domain-containing protein 10 n=1 Tax=Thelohanellus kitauei TaxID=669202 RepID=A0A0C2IIS8_THEKT|nr:Kelch domain-containing protein 10 [Thelohanellus kitauei]
MLLSNIDEFTDEGPEERTRHTMCVMDDHLFIYGGFKNSIRTLLGYLWCYNITQDRWSKKIVGVPLHLTCSSAEIISHDSYLYIFGCTDFQNGHFVTNVISRYDTLRRKWELVSQTDLDFDESGDRPCFVSCFFQYDKHLYIIADTTSNISRYSIFKYSLVNKSWSPVDQKGDIPEFTCQVFGAVCDHRYFYFCDGDREHPKRFQTVVVFDLRKCVWTTVDTFSDNGEYPCDRTNFSITFSDIYGYLSGGVSEGQKKLDDIWCLNLLSLRWQRLDVKLQAGIMLHRSAIHANSTLYVFGGVEVENIKLNKLQKFYIRPPSLFQICLGLAYKFKDEEMKKKKLPIQIAEQMNFIV